GHTRWSGDWSSDVCSSDLREGDILGTHRDEHLVVGPQRLGGEHAHVADLGAHAIVPIRGVGAEHRAIEEVGAAHEVRDERVDRADRKSTRLNSSHQIISYAVFCLKKKKRNKQDDNVQTISTSRVQTYRDENYH